jgi:hypothetical protein
MDALGEFLADLKRQGLVQGHFLGLLHLLIGRQIAAADGTVLCRGLTWRDLAAALKKVRWDKASVRELGLDPAMLPPRDRQQFWYTAIASASVDSARAQTAADLLADLLRAQGYRIGAAPGT